MRFVLLCLLLGLATTVVIAWVGAAFETAYHRKAVSERLVFDKHTSRYYLVTGLLVTRNMVSWEADADLASLNPSWIDAKANAAVAHAPYWSEAWVAEKPSRPHGTWGNWPHESELNEFAAGWPFRALRCEADEPVQDSKSKHAVYSFRSGLALPTHVIKDGNTNVYLPRALPYRPIWPGLLADVAIFWAAWALVLLVRPAVRAYRVSKGRCAACGYDLRGLAAGVPCPECGLVPSRARVIGRVVP